MRVVAVQVFPPKLQDLWEEWNLRVAVLISLFFQIILIFFASARKRSGNMLIQVVIWSSYLLADWIAAFAVGLISSNQGEKGEEPTVNEDLAAFWAPFLLLHLGGPDTITAFSLEDNELWLRHMLNVIVQVLAVGYVFMQSLPNQFWLPTALMFFAGTVKYAERTRALYLACLSNLKDFLPKPDINVQKVLDEFSSNQSPEVPWEIHRVPEPDEATEASTVRGTKDLEVKETIQRAYRFYVVFRGLIVDHMVSSESRKFFFSLNAREALKIMEVELNFMYDALYTKMAVVHQGFFWCILRFVCSASLVAAFVLFATHHKPNIHRFDMAVSYALLVGAVILDFVAFVKLIFSDWTIALIEDSGVLSILANQPLHPRILKVMTSGVLAIHKSISFRKRWSEYLYQHNLLTYCLQKRCELLDKTAELFALKEFHDMLRYKKKQNLGDDLKEFIFNKLKEKAEKEEEIIFEDTLSARGERILVEYGCPKIVVDNLSKFEYDFNVLMWHIITDICFYRGNIKRCKDEENRTRCKQLSDYLLYLLIMQPKLMLPVASVAQSRFYDTCEEARKFFGQYGSKLAEPDACEKLINMDHLDTSMPYLGAAIYLAKNLKNMVDENPEKTWEMMSKVWLELLCYGASNCAGHAHAQQLRQGGELITLVWLVMAHLGFGVLRAVHMKNYSD